MRVVRNGLLVAALVAAALPVLGSPARSAAPPAARPGALVPAAPRGEDVSRKLAARAVPPVVWPAAGRAEVERGTAPARVGGLPVRVATADGRPGRVGVEVLDRAATARARVSGLVIRVRHAVTDEDRAARRSTVDIDYSGFRGAFGGDYAARLRLVKLPDCAPSAGPACGRSQPVPSTNDQRTGRVSARVVDGTYALTAGASGAAGSFKPTSLAPSATWQVGPQSGDFQWSYPLRTPQLPGGAPELALDYSSGRVDGRTAATNNQPSWAGEGFELQPGFIERSYQPCAEDGQAGVGDLCWATNGAGKLVQSATVSLPGLNSELVRDDATGAWRAEQDEGWRTELLTGAANGDDGTASPDDRGEYWRLTAPDGTQYHFGRNRMPGWTAGAAETNSTLTVPVFGNHAGEPCKGGTFATSWCQQAYRWMLDFVVTPHGDVTAYHYDRESNNYGRNATPGAPTPYVRAANVARIEYGLRLGTLYTVPAAARVLFDTAERCRPGSPCQQSQSADFPDTPLDQACASVCPVSTPTFWGTRRLAKVTTQVNDGGYRDVDSWTLTHTFPATGDTSAPSLWLESIVHTGHVGGTASMPAIDFDPGTTPEGEGTPNRIDIPGDTQPAMRKFRLGAIHNETGGRTEISYAATDCRADALPVPDSNTARCFPVYWSTELAAPTRDWFAKYLVTRVTETDLVGGESANPKITEYEYDGAGAWHHDDAELVPDRYKSWGQWRGYQRVRIRTGGPADGPRTLTEHVYLRGMHGDRNADGSTKSVTVDGLADEQPLRGFARQTTVFDGDSPTVLSRTVARPVQLPVSATRDRAGGPLRARVTQVLSTTTTTTVPGGSRVTEQRYGYNGYGLLTETHDLGDLALPGDDTCVVDSYAVNEASWLLNARSRQRTVAGDCQSTEVLADRRFIHDGATDWGTPPTKGDVTRVEEGTESGYQVTERSVADEHGRPVERRDASGDLTRTEYTPAAGGPVTGTVVTDPAGFAVTTTIDPLLGQPVSVRDANGGVTTSGYDPLGRLTSVWLPGRATTATPNHRYSYLVPGTGPSVVTSQRLIGTGAAYRTSTELFDGFLRTRQVQQPAPGGGRVLTDTRYDTHGRVARTSAPRFDSGSPGTGLVAQPAVLAAETRLGYDGAGRQSTEALYGAGVERWRTTTSHGGDRISVDPPVGGTATVEIRDARDRTVELRQFLGGASSGAYQSTRYTYTLTGQLATITDHAGNTWRYGYDRRGRQVRAETPDSGTRSTSYDAEGRVLTSTDGNGRALGYDYDQLGRRTAVREGATTLASWAYDTATNGRGRPASSTRHAATGDIVTGVTGYDLRGRITGTALTVTEPGLAGTYRTGHVWYEDDQPYTATLTLPVANLGGLATTETLRHGYESSGLPSTLLGQSSYVTATTYTRTGELESYQLGAAGKQVTRAFGYDPVTRWLTRAETRRQGQSAAADVSYSYDQVGGVTRIANAVNADTQCLRYDGLRRLVEGWTPAGGDCAPTPSVAGLGGPARYWDSWSFDDAGNRATEIRRGAAGESSRTYGYPAPGTAQPHTLRSVRTEDSGGVRTDTFSYDADGNTLTRPGQQLGWDAEGRLTTVTAAGQTSSFGYDADGNRVLRRDAGGTTLYVGDTELHRNPAGVVTGTRYYRHNGGTVALRRGGTVSWLATDHHGTAETLLDSATLAATTRLMGPYGQPRAAAAGWIGDRGFVGGSADPDSALVHLGARQYDPDTGRFVSADPVTDAADPQQLGGYAYANHNPVTFTDPDGLLTKKKTAAPAPKHSLVRTTVKSDKPAKSSTRSTVAIGATATRSSKPLVRGSQDRLYQAMERRAASYVDWDFELGGEIWTWDDGGGGASSGYYLDDDLTDWYGDDYYSLDDYYGDGYEDDYEVPVVQYEERSCVGWNQCLYPRPIEQSVVWESAAGVDSLARYRSVPTVPAPLPYRFTEPSGWAGPVSWLNLPAERRADLPTFSWRRP
ncbi:RHS repeat-associated core domain-containing protein [Micromonospora rubida]|uniref:RHS repeat-associated core domain-containing protein n=1 Tax=Micromonospora rubida TaxID=2697657 RepID=A0ABW7SHW5_9ACTN